MLKMKFHPTFIIVAMMIAINISSAKQNDVSVKNSTVVAPLAAGTIKSTFNASWTWANPIFKSDHGSYEYYYDVFEIVASTSGDYDFTSKAAVANVGYLYLPIFNPSSPDKNIVEYDDSGEADGTFEFTHYLEAGIQYYLVATTYEFLEIGQYQVIITGMARVTINRKTVLEPIMESVVIKSTLTHLLPQLETVCDSSSYQSYDIYSVVAAANGTFFIETATKSGVTIRLHSPSFNPLDTILNVVAFDVNSEYYTRQLVNVSLVGLVQYYLVLSKGHDEDAAYRLTFRGPSNFTIIKLTDQFISTVKTSTFSLTNKSPTYSQDYNNGVYYYKVFRITVERVGIYTLLGYSDTSLRDDLYENSFSPSLPYQNFISTGYYSDGQAEFITKVELTPNKDYYWVVTTDYQKVIADFNLTAVGPSPVTVAAVPDSVKSNVTLSSSLTSSNPKFTRCEEYYSNFYYRLFKISVPSLGLYTMRTQGSMNTFGCLYINQFNPTSSSSDLMSYDDQSAGNDQFAITTILKTNTTYYLAATTKRRNVIGSFELVVSGPAKATVRAVSTP